MDEYSREAKKIIRQYCRDVDKCKKEMRNGLIKCLKRIEKETNDMWNSIVKQYYDQYKPTEVYHREYGFYDTNSTGMTEHGIVIDVEDTSSLNYYHSVKSDEEGNYESVSGDYVFNLFMNGKRGNAEGLAKLYPWIKNSKYYLECSTFSVEYSFKGTKLSGTPREVVDAYFKIQQDTMEEEMYRLWDKLYSKFKTLSYFFD